MQFCVRRVGASLHEFVRAEGYLRERGVSGGCAGGCEDPDVAREGGVLRGISSHCTIPRGPERA